MQLGVDTKLLVSAKKETTNEVEIVKSASSSMGKMTADDIRKLMNELFIKAKSEGKESIEFVSGQLHRILRMHNRMPQVCRIMYEKMQPGDEILSTTLSGKSSTIRIRYYLHER